MTVRLTENKDFSELKRLWKAAFGDSDETIQHFLEAAPLACALCACDKDDIVASMYLFDCELYVGGARRRTAYMYALATDEKRRGEGIMTELIEYACKFLRAGGYDFALLSPADDRLSHYYEKRGFSLFCNAKVADIPAYSVFNIPTETRRLSAAEYKELHCRNNNFSELFVAWSDRYIEFALEFCDAQIIAFDGGAAVCESDGDTVRVTEHFGELNHMLSAVKNTFPAERYRIILPSNALIGECRCQAMLRPFGDCPIPPNDNGRAPLGFLMD